MLKLNPHLYGKSVRKKITSPFPPIAIMYLLSLIENILLRMESIKIIQQ